MISKTQYVNGEEQCIQENAMHGKKRRVKVRKRGDNKERVMSRRRVRRKRIPTGMTGMKKKVPSDGRSTSMKCSQLVSCQRFKYSNPLSSEFRINYS